MSPNSRQLETLLGSISTSIDQITELEESFNNRRAQLTKELASHVAGAAKLSDTQAVRAQVVRQLYWNRKIPAEIISNAFGLTTRRLQKIAGPFSMTFDCVSGCGNSYERRFSSRSDMENFIRERRGKRAKYFQSHYMCEDCERTEKAREEARASRKRAFLKSRDEQLRNMPWLEFIESKEWTTFRNEHIHHVGYSCELCDVGRETLYAHLLAEAVQGHPSVQSNHFGIAVMCRGCKPRYHGLIIEEKGEAINTAAMERISNWNQEYHPEDDDY
jgi:hypothetical protein